MSYSRLTYLGDGSNITFVINFTLGFLDREDVTCRVANEVDGFNLPVYRTITWINDGLVTISGTPPAINAEVVFDRTVSKTILEHDYEDGAIIQETNLDESNKQLMMAIHEILDGRFDSAPSSGTEDLVTQDQFTAQISDLQSQIDAINASLAGITAAAVAASLAAVTAQIDAAIAEALNDFSPSIASDLVFHIREVQSAGVSAGSFTSGIWTTRSLNSVVLNEITDASLDTGTGEITLPIGTYTLEAHATASFVNQNKIKLYNATDDSDIIIGQTARTDHESGEMNNARLFCKFTLDEESVLIIQHKCTTTRNTFGLGYGQDMGSPECFTDVIIRKQGTADIDGPIIVGGIGDPFELDLLFPGSSAGIPFTSIYTFTQTVKFPRVPGFLMFPTLDLTAGSHDSINNQYFSLFTAADFAPDVFGWNFGGDGILDIASVNIGLLPAGVTSVDGDTNIRIAAGTQIYFYHQASGGPQSADLADVRLIWTGTISS